MDNFAEASPEPPVTHRWATPLPVVVVGWVAAAGALAWCLLANADPAGRMLIGLAAVACGYGALYGTVTRPRLSADHFGVRVRGLTGATDYDWAAVESVDVVLTRRWGRSVPSLELDTRSSTGATGTTPGGGTTGDGGTTADDGTTGAATGESPVRASDGSATDDPAERLHIFGRLDLGTDPRDVADTLRRLRRS